MSVPEVSVVGNLQQQKRPYLQSSVLSALLNQVVPSPKHLIPKHLPPLLPRLLIHLPQPLHKHLFLGHLPLFLPRLLVYLPQPLRKQPVLNHPPSFLPRPSVHLLQPLALKRPPRFLPSLFRRLSPPNRPFSPATQLLRHRRLLSWRFQVRSPARQRD